jgi:act minimal PKS acyl carrier protein
MPVRAYGCRRAGLDEGTTVTSFTLADLQAILDKCLPDEEASRLDEGNLGVDLGELGYDSLVIAEFAVRLREDFGVSIPDDELDELKTPGSLVAYVSQRIPAAR